MTTIKPAPMRVECVMVQQKPDYKRYAGDLLRIYKKKMRDPEFRRKFEEWQKKEGTP